MESLDRRLLYRLAQKFGFRAGGWIYRVDITVSSGCEHEVQVGAALGMGYILHQLAHTGINPWAE